MAKERRFERVYDEGALNCISVYVDNETGINYLFVKEGYAGGLTPLLDKDGNPVITPVNN